jgi:LPXTG-motif cell wall-anchored protein
VRGRPGLGEHRAGDLLPGQSTSGTHNHTAGAGDVPQIVDTATATADIDTASITSTDVGAQAVDPVSVTATSSVTVAIAEVAGLVVTSGSGTSGTGLPRTKLPFTGADSRSLLTAGLVVLVAGLALGVVGWRRRRSLLGT